MKNYFHVNRNIVIILVNIFSVVLKKIVNNDYAVNPP
jgi:hypothetical protein